MNGPMAGVAADTMRVAATALLLARGCPPDRAADAMAFLGRRRIAQTVPELIEDIDLAIAHVIGDDR